MSSEAGLWRDPSWLLLRRLWDNKHPIAIRMRITQKSEDSVRLCHLKKQWVRERPVSARWVCSGWRVQRTPKPTFSSRIFHEACPQRQRLLKWLCHFLWVTKTLLGSWHIGMAPNDVPNVYCVTTLPHGYLTTQTEPRGAPLPKSHMTSLSWAVVLGLRIRVTPWEFYKHASSQWM